MSELYENRTEHGPKRSKPLRFEATVFGAGVLFFAPIAIVYGLLADWEPVGTVGLLLLAGMSGLTGAYLWITGHRLDPLPEDDPVAEIDERAGEVGVFSPHSWTPLVLGIAAAMAFLGLTIGWWLTGLGVAVGLVGIGFQITEFSRGQHRH